MFANHGWSCQASHQQDDETRIEVDPVTHR